MSAPAWYGHVFLEHVCRLPSKYSHAAGPQKSNWKIPWTSAGQTLLNHLCLAGRSCWYGALEQWEMGLCAWPGGFKTAWPGPAARPPHPTSSCAVREPHRPEVLRKKGDFGTDPQIIEGGRYIATLGDQDAGQAAVWGLFQPPASTHTAIACWAWNFSALDRVHNRSSARRCTTRFAW